jgi:SAM-dependent methyltransferase
VASWPAPRFSSGQVARYYDLNTATFVALGQGGSVGAIHRAVWAPGVSTRDAAFHHVDELVADIVRRLPPRAEPPHVVDLGCGIGSSLCYLAERLPIRGTGITLSAVQAEMATSRIRDAGLSGRVTCIQGDFCDLPPIAAADVAMAVESFAHATSPEQFFAQCRSLVRPGGALVICDDFRGRVEDADARAAVDRFCRGWHLNSLIDVEAVKRMAAGAGFEHESTIDLSPYLRVLTPRDRVMNAVLTLVRWLPVYRTRLGPMIGGGALQLCLARGWVRYSVVAFRQRAGS